MEDLRAMHTGVPYHDDWENWTDDDEPVALKAAANKTGTSTRSSKGRQSNPKILRLKSRKRQKAQNEKAGIRVVTDLSRFRKGPQHVAQLIKPLDNNNKFVDASALRALEGSPNSASVGNWAWLKKGGHSPASAATGTPTAPSPSHPFSVSPDGSKIVIGIAMPDNLVATNTNPTSAPPPPPSTVQQQNHQPKSAWSPDTEDGFSPARYLHLSSNNLGIYPAQQVPPVPAVPSPFKNPALEKLSSSEVDDDDNFTPVTLFEEDGKSPASAISTKISPATTARSRSGWWDHVKTPFKERFSPVVARTDKETASPAVAADEWWKSADEKKTLGTAMSNQQPFYTGASSSSSTTLHPTTVPVIRVPTPTTTASSSRSSPPPSRQESHSEKARVVLEDHADPSDVPPPYEPTQTSSEKNNKNAQALRYRAVFPPGHPLATQFPPSPMPVSPGLDANMTARGDMKMSDVPLTPAPTGATATTATAEPALPDRVAGTYVTGEQFRDIEGVSSPAAKVEKARRRHEKEDYLAHRVGGFWKGRGCLPEDGCYGRSGREGRKRRRVWLGLCLAFLLLIIVGVVLGVVLSRELANDSHASSSGGSGGEADGSGSGSSSGTSASSVWLNLTDFPPIPTGLATIVGADNSEEVTGCVSPATLWSCSLPPEQQAANEPQEANQPMFIFQIQYDNNTRQLWDIPNGDAPTPDTTTAAAATSSSSKASSTSASKTTSTVTVAATTATTTSTAEASSSSDDDEGGDLSRRDDDTTLYDTGIAPNPSPPSYDEMWFLGNWTDGIVSDEKAGEPTPFYISFFTSLNGSAGPNRLTKRGDIGSGSDNGENVTDTLPSPILNADGTGAAAQLRPFPYQQPLRLYDRGLATEHYGFYSYFNKTIYVDSVDNTTTSTSSEDGGVLETSAAWYATWTQTRFIVKIWTKKTASGARLIGTSGSAASSNGTAPGSFPYPVTVGEDTHGGDLSLKTTFAYGVEADQHVNTSEAVSFTNNIGYGSAVVNPRLPDGDLSWGGVDGGTGGCRCEWVNWVEADGTTDGSLG